MRKFYSFLILIVSTWGATAQVTFNYTGAVQTYTVPSGVTSLEVYLWGAGGAGSDRTGGNNAGAGGSGAFVKGLLAVTPGQVLNIVVGGGGTYSTATPVHLGGYGGGGSAYANAGSGGGYSGIFLAAGVSQGSARAIAGGGAGAGAGRDRNYGGAGGATSGSAGAGLDATHTGGGGATLAAGGTAGAGTGTVSGAAGSALQGGTGGNSTYGGAGGGGGYFGGGGGYGSTVDGNSGTWSSGGGGGSSFTTNITSVTNTAGNWNNTGVANNPPGVAEPYYNGTAGVGGGGNGSNGANGLVVIRPANCSGTPTITSVSISATTGAPGAALTLSAVIGSAVSGLTYQWQSGTSATGPWTNIAGATTNPATVYAPSTVSTTTWYRLVLTCSGSGLSANSTTTLSYTTSSCTPSASNTDSYFSNVNTGTTYTINISQTSTNTGGYANYYATQQASPISAGGTLVLNFTTVNGTGGGPTTAGLAIFADWNDDGLFDITTERLYTSNGLLSAGTYTATLTIPVSAPVGDHRLRLVTDRNSSNPDPCTLATGTRGEAEDYKITIAAASCSTAPTTSAGTHQNSYYFSRIAFTGAPVTAAANTSTAGLVSGYSNYMGLGAQAQQEQGEGINIDVTMNTRAKLSAWVDWNNDGVYSSPDENVYSIATVHTTTTTFGFQIPIGTTPGNYKLRIRNYNYFDDFDAPNSLVTPCGALHNGETEDYIFTVTARCNARISTVTNQTLCSSTGIAFTLNTTGTTSATGFNWYNASSGGSALSGATFLGGTPPAGSFTTPAISASTNYYVSATGVNTLGVACESPRVLVQAIYNAASPLTFNPAGPIFVCQGASLSVSGGAGTESKVLVNEDFEAGGLGVFTVSNSTATPAASVADMQWRNRTSVYIPTYASVWRPAISSGFGTNKFALAVADIAGADLNSSLQLSTAVNTVGFTNLTLEYDLFYDSYLNTGTDGGSGLDVYYVEYSTDNFTTSTSIHSFIVDQGLGTQFLHYTVALPAGALNQSNLKIRFRYRANWVNGVAVDNIKLYGTSPTSSSYTWTAVGTGADPLSMYTSPVFTAPNQYVAGTNVAAIYVNPTAAQIAAGNDLDFQASLTLSNGCVATGIITVKLSDKVWTGDEDTNWHNPANWCGNTVPTSATSVFIPAGVTNMPIISTGAAFAKKIDIAALASLTINVPGTGSLTVPGDFTNLGTLTNNATIILNGSTGVTQNFPGAGTVAAMSTLQINTGIGGVKLNNSFRIQTELRPTQGTLALDNYNITLASTASKTAYVSAVGASADFSYGTGRFIVERYIGYTRKWQSLSVPALTTQTIYQSWQDNGSSTTSPTGYGVQITGPSVANGIEAYSATASMKYYVPATDLYTGITVTNASPAGLLQRQEGYFLYVYGNRAATSMGGAGSPTTLRTTGKLFVGRAGHAELPPSLSVGTGLFSSVGNPFASPIDFDTWRGANANMDNNFLVWDPSLFGEYSAGAYQTVAGSTGYIATPGGSPVYTSSTTDYSAIQSGTAYYIRASTAFSNHAFSESHKVAGSMSVNRGGETTESVNPEDVKMLSTMLYYQDRLADGNRVVFDNMYSDALDVEDARKMTNNNIDFGMIRGTDWLVVESRSNIKLTDTVHYAMYGLYPGSYHLAFGVQNLIAPGIIGELVDRYTGSRHTVSLTDSSFVPFTINGDAASSAEDRFILVFKSVSVVPVTFVEVKAQRQQSGSINVSWKVANEVNIDRYEVERSANGINFTQLLSTDATNSTVYTKPDNQPLSADNYYRIKAIGRDGNLYYSNIVKVGFQTRMPAIIVSPNPVVDKKVNLRFIGQSQGAATVSITNAIGQEITRKAININSDDITTGLNLPANTAAGTYQVIIRNRDSKIMHTETLMVH